MLCLTAIAKPDMKEEIIEYFREELGIELRVFDGGDRRTNLDFVVVPTRSSAKLDDIHPSGRSEPVWPANRSQLHQTVAGGAGETSTTAS